MLIIKKNILNKNSKAILNYCFRIFIFLLLSRKLILVPLGEYFIQFVGLFMKNVEGDDGFIYGILILMFLPYYILPKICGLFKKLDNLNIFFSIIIILFIDFLYCFSQALTVQIIPLKISLNRIEIYFFLICFFFVYKFLNFLTKIFPMPFKQIGYIFSIELVKDIYNDVKKDIKENYLKNKNF